MDQSLKSWAIERVGFSLKNEERKVAETETLETKEVEVSEVKNSVNEKFARLKKSLRKRSVSIL